MICLPAISVLCYGGEGDSTPACNCGERATSLRINQRTARSMGCTLESTKGVTLARAACSYRRSRLCPSVAVRRVCQRNPASNWLGDTSSQPLLDLDKLHFFYMNQVPH